MQVPAPAGWVVTFLAVSFAWIFFRGSAMKHALRHDWGSGRPERTSFRPTLVGVRSRRGARTGACVGCRVADAKYAATHRRRSRPRCDRRPLSSLQEKLIKIGAKVVHHARYAVFQMAEVAVPRELFEKILRLIEGHDRPQRRTKTGRRHHHHGWSVSE